MRSISALLTVGVLTTTSIVLVESGSRPVMAQTVDARKAEADSLYQQGIQKFRENQDDNEDLYREAFQLLEQALKIYREIQDHSDEANALFDLGEISAQLEQDEQGIDFYQQALIIYRKIDDRRGVVQVLTKLGERYQSLRKHQQALDQYQQALTIAREIDDQEAEIRLLLAITKVLTERRWWESIDEQTALAQDYLHQARALVQTLENSDSKAEALAEIGLGYADLEQFTEALSLLQQARTIYQQQQNQGAELALLENITKLYLRYEQFEQALSSFQDALRLARELGDRESEIVILIDLSDAYFDRRKLNRPEQGLESLRTALKIAQELENPEIELGVLKPLSDAYSAELDQPEKALETLKAALEIAQRLENQKIELDILQDIRNIYSDLGQIEEELAILQTALGIAQRIDDPELEINILQDMSRLRGQSAQGLDALEAALKIAQRVDDREQKANLLVDIAREYFNLNQLSESQKYLQEALLLYQELGEPQDQANILLRLGFIEVGQGKIEQAENYFSQGISIIQSVPDQGNWWGRDSVASYLSRIGEHLAEIGSYSLSLKYYEQILAHYKELAAKISSHVEADSDSASDSDSEETLEEIREEQADTLQEIAWVYFNQNQLLEAEQRFQQSITIYQELGDRREVSTLRDTIETLQSGGVRATQLVEAERLLDEAMDLVRDEKIAEGQQKFEQVRAIYRQSGLRRNEASALARFAGRAWGRAKLSPEIALSYYQQILKIDQELGNRYEEAQTWNDIGYIYSNLEESTQAIEAYQQELAIYRELGDRNLEAESLENLGDYYLEIQRFAQATDIYQQALVIARETCAESRSWWGKDSNKPEAWQDSTILKTLIKIYHDYRQEGGEIGRINSLLAQAYQAIQLGQLQQALPLLQEVLQLSQENPQKTALLETQLGWIYADLNQPTEAVKHFQQALEFYRQQNDLSQQLHLLNQLGWVYVKTEQTGQAVDAFRQALAIQRLIGNQEHIGTTFSILSSLFEKQGQPELAIVFYKQFVNQAEELRQQLQVLPRGQQGPCNQINPNVIYRKLADLLLSQGRIPEAEKVLSLLKLEEIQEYSRGAVANPQTRQTLPPTPAEQVILDEHDSIIAFAGKIAECERNPDCPTTELSQLNEQRAALLQEFEKSVQQFSEEAQARRARGGDQQAIGLETDRLTSLGADIVKAQPNTVLLYPVVLEEKLWVLWFSAAGVANAIEVPVTEQEITQAVFEFRSLMRDCEWGGCDSKSAIQEIQTVSQKLYNWIIPPQIEQELEQNGIENIIFAPDWTLRYIPMTALFDGEQYLIENYAVSTITATSLENRDQPLSRDASVLALGLSEAVPENPVAGIPSFGALDYVETELRAIVRSSNSRSAGGMYPGVEKLNEFFDQNAFLEATRHQILHIATHGYFDPSSFDASYLILGTKDPWRISALVDPAVRPAFRDISLVVLSACETALGLSAETTDRRTGDGREVSSIAQAFIDAGANTVIASLWQVNDGSTSELMQQFYQNLATQPNTTVTKAMQQAQLQMLRGNSPTTSNTPRGNPATSGNPATVRVESPVSPDGTPKYAHPYYWSGFIIIGNGQ